MTYPDTPGFKGTMDTGRDAAATFAPKLGPRQAEVMSVLARGPATAEQIGAALDRHWYVIRPRISELKAMGLVVDTGRRPQTELGGKTHEVRLTTPAERGEGVTLG